MIQRRCAAATAIAVTATVALTASCDSHDAEPVPTQPVSTPTSAAPSRGPPPTGSSKPSEPPAAGTSSRRATIETDGGSVVVAADGAELVVVSLTTKEGWEVAVERPDARRLEASFTSSDGRAVVTVELTETGITSSTRSETTG